MTTLASYFRSIGTTDQDADRVTLKDNAPEWLLAAVRDSHQSDLPNDWIWKECQAACEAIDDGSSLTDDDSIHEYADSRVDIYTRDVFQWLADMCLTSTYANAELEVKDMGTDFSDLETAVKSIQYCAIRYIATVMLQASKENA